MSAHTSSGVYPAARPNKTSHCVSGRKDFAASSCVTLVSARANAGVFSSMPRLSSPRRRRCRTLAPRRSLRSSLSRGVSGGRVRCFVSDFDAARGRVDGHVAALCPGVGIIVVQNLQEGVDVAGVRERERCHAMPGRSGSTGIAGCAHWRSSRDATRCGSRLRTRRILR